MKPKKDRNENKYNLINEDIGLDEKNLIMLSLVAVAAQVYHWLLN